MIYAINNFLTFRFKELLNKLINKYIIVHY